MMASFKQCLIIIQLDSGSCPDAILLDGQIVLVHCHPGWEGYTYHQDDADDAADDGDTDVDDNDSDDDL